MTPPLGRVLETGLYVEDVARSREWYERIFGLKVFLADDRFAALDVDGTSVLLLFKRGGTLDPITLPGGVIPPHDGQGQMHYAFAVTMDALPQWEQRLVDLGIAIISRVTWPLGGKSIYFHDPDGHVGELATPGTWPTY